MKIALNLITCTLILILCLKDLKADYIPERELLTKEKIHFLNEVQLEKLIIAISEDMKNYETAFSGPIPKTTLNWLRQVQIFDKAYAHEAKVCIHNATVQLVQSGCEQTDGYSFETSKSPSIEILKNNKLDTSCSSEKGQACGIMAGITSTPGLLCSKKGTGYCLKRSIKVNAQKRLAKTLAACFQTKSKVVSLPITDKSQKVTCLPLVKSFMSQYLLLKQFCESEEKASKRQALAKVCHQTYLASQEIWDEVQKSANNIPQIEKFLCSNDGLDFIKTNSCNENEDSNKENINYLLGSSRSILSYLECEPEKVPEVEVVTKAKTSRAHICTESSPLNIRRGPSSDEQVVAKVPKGSTVTLLNHSPSDNWAKIKWDNTIAYAHAGYICSEDSKVKSPSIRKKVLAFISPKKKEFDYIKGSKCDHRNYSGHYKTNKLGDRYAFLKSCYAANQISKRICMDMTCPNTGRVNQNAFRKLYGNKVPYQMIPPKSEYKYGVRLAQLVSKLERSGVCVKQITNWHRTARYNDTRAVGGSKGSYHKVKGGGKAVDILLCTRTDQRKAASLVNKWSKNGSWPGGVGIYHNSYTLHVDLRGYPARW